MRIDIITVLPEMLEGFLNVSIVGRARKRGLAEICVHNLRDFTADKHKRVDDYPFGGFAGMVMQCQPIDDCISILSAQRTYDEVIFTSPDGQPFTQQLANELSLKKNLIILCGHYKDVDYRVRSHLVTKEISIGDYVLSGGEIAAAAIADSVVRLLPGAMGNEESALYDSFQDGLLSPPMYTRPANYKGWEVPPILLSGNTANIEEWALNQSLERTRRLRPNLLADKLKLEKPTKIALYKQLLKQLQAIAATDSDTIARMANFSSLIKETFGWHWVGFYRVENQEQLVLGPFQGNLACTRIDKGRGVCGTAWRDKRTLIVPDVSKFEGHIACSSETKSEIVVPVFNTQGEITAVLDIDSVQPADFDDVDSRYLEKIARLVGGK